MIVTRTITYECDDVGRLGKVLDASLTDGVHQIGDLKITVQTQDANVVPGDAGRPAAVKVGELEWRGIDPFSRKHQPNYDRE